MLIRRPLMAGWLMDPLLVDWPASLCDKKRSGIKWMLKMIYSWHGLRWPVQVLRASCASTRILIEQLGAARSTCRQCGLLHVVRFANLVFLKGFNSPCFLCSGRSLHTRSGGGWVTTATTMTMKTTNKRDNWNVITQYPSAHQTTVNFGISSARRGVTDGGNGGVGGGAR